jgi:hypothetical protein
VLEAAGFARQPLFYLVEMTMRGLLPILCLALASCGSDPQAADNSAVAEESDSAATTVGNDVTAIDAATGDAANMAADVNYTVDELDSNQANSASDDNSASNDSL